MIGTFPPPVSVAMVWPAVFDVRPTLDYAFINNRIIEWRSAYPVAWQSIIDDADAEYDLNSIRPQSIFRLSGDGAIKFGVHDSAGEFIPQQIRIELEGCLSYVVDGNRTVRDMCFNFPHPRKMLLHPSKIIRNDNNHRITESRVPPFDCAPVSSPSSIGNGCVSLMHALRRRSMHTGSLPLPVASMMTTRHFVDVSSIPVMNIGYLDREGSVAASLNKILHNTTTTTLDDVINEMKASDPEILDAYAKSVSDLIFPVSLRSRKHSQYFTEMMICVDTFGYSSRKANTALFIIGNLLLLEYVSDEGAEDDHCIQNRYEGRIWRRTVDGRPFKADEWELHWELATSFDPASTFDTTLPIDFFNLSWHDHYYVEYRLRAARPWLAQPWRRHSDDVVKIIGSVIDARHKNGSWYQANIVATDDVSVEATVTVHFIGMGKYHDRVIPMKHWYQRAAANSHTAMLAGVHTFTTTSYSVDTEITRAEAMANGGRRVIGPHQLWLRFGYAIQPYAFSTTLQWRLIRHTDTTLLSDVVKSMSAEYASKHDPAITRQAQYDAAGGKDQCPTLAEVDQLFTHVGRYDNCHIAFDFGENSMEIKNERMIKSRSFAMQRCIHPSLGREADDVRYEGRVFKIIDDTKYHASTSFDIADIPIISSKFDMAMTFAALELYLHDIFLIDYRHLALRRWMMMPWRMPCPSSWPTIKSIEFSAMEVGLVIDVRLRSSGWFPATVVARPSASIVQVKFLGREHREPMSMEFSSKTIFIRGVTPTYTTSLAPFRSFSTTNIIPDISEIKTALSIAAKAKALLMSPEERVRKKKANDKRKRNW